MLVCVYNQGESQRDVEERMRVFIEALLQPADGVGAGDAKDPPITIAVFTHGMAIKCLMRAIAKSSPAATYKLTMTNTGEQGELCGVILRCAHPRLCAGITEISYSVKAGGAGGWSITRVNDAAHLE